MLLQRTEEAITSFLLYVISDHLFLRIIQAPRVNFCIKSIVPSIAAKIACQFCSQWRLFQFIIRQTQRLEYLFVLSQNVLLVVAGGNKCFSSRKSQTAIVFMGYNFTQNSHPRISGIT